MRMRWMNPGSMTRSRAKPSACARAVCLGGLSLLLPACEAPPDTDSTTLSPAERFNARNAEHRARFGDYDIPRQIGSVENIGLQIPRISPDGQRMLYLRTDQPFVSPMTLLGSCEPAHTPPDGHLEIWIRPTHGRDPGSPLSTHRWSHSPVWSESGRYVAYVAHDVNASRIIRVNLADGRQDALGVPEHVNCLPRFNDDDHTLLFCAGESAGGPFRVYRQAAGGAEPIPLSPQGTDCVLPLVADESGSVICAHAAGARLSWVRSTANGVTGLVHGGGSGERPALLQTWAGISTPLSPDRRSWLFYDPLRESISVHSLADQRTVDFRDRSIAACWLADDTIALAGVDRVFVLNTFTGLRLDLFNGQWIPLRYVPLQRRLLMLGPETPQRFKVVEVTFRTRPVESLE